jgi:hypothetical protein
MSRASDLLDFRLASLQIARKSSFGCWIFVGFRVAMNVCSHQQRLQKHRLTCSFDEWAVLGFEPATPAL